ncbi:hypothetical protein D3C77_319340 [compost metagenome]
MKNFAEYCDYKRFERYALPYLLGAIKRFLGCEARYDARPIEGALLHHKIDILDNVNRGVYLLENNTVAIILGRVLNKNEVICAFSLTLKSSYFIGMEKLLNNFESALALTLSNAPIKSLSNRPQQFGDELVELAIAKHLGKGSFDHRKVLYLASIFKQLASTQLEGSNFTTGLVITRSLFAFSNKSDQTRQGELLPLSKNYPLSPINPIDKRFWYLADGQTSFYVADKNLITSNLFITNDSETSLSTFVDDYTLSKSIKGSDILLRVTSTSELSIVGSEGIEFNYKENMWRARNLTKISSIIRSSLEVDESFAQALIFFLFYLSRERLSSIIWIPNDEISIGDFIKNKNRLTIPDLSISNKKHTQTVLRLLSSDGASVISKAGNLISFGSMIDISKIAIDGIKGSGEIAASTLGKNGLSIKISQDGRIKLFSETLNGPLTF